MLLANFFFYLRWKTSFFWRSTSDNFFFMFRPRIFLSYAFPIMYVTIWCFFLVSIFFINFDNKLFFLTFVATTYFFQFYFSPPPPPQISNGASLNIIDDAFININVNYYRIYLNTYLDIFILDCI